MTRRRRRRPDTRPRWDDPDLCFHIWGRDWTPERIQEIAQRNLSMSMMPHYTKDPAYNWAQTRARNQKEAPPCQPTKNDSHSSTTSSTTQPTAPSKPSKTDSTS